MKREELDASTGEVDEDSLMNDDSSSGSDHIDGSGSETGDDPAPIKRKNNVLAIARRETMYVLCSKTMAYLVLFLAAIACGFATYYFVEDDEYDTFKSNVR
jgi:hypothetical protein